MIDDAFREVLSAYIASNHRKKVEIIERAYRLLSKFFIFFILLFGSIFMSKKYHILCVFYMVLGTEIGCFCRIKN